MSITPITSHKTPNISQIVQKQFWGYYYCAVLEIKTEYITLTVEGFRGNSLYRECYSRPVFGKRISPNIIGFNTTIKI